MLVIRGILNVFSLGLDDLACELSRRGYQVDIAPPSMALIAAAAIEQQYARDPDPLPIVIIGHSLGGRFCCSVPWDWRKQNIRVNLLVILDSNPLTAVPDNVDRCVNLYVTNDLGLFHGQDAWAISPRTALVNLDITKVTRPPGVPPVDHFSIDDSAWIHQLVIEEIDRSCGVRHRALPLGDSDSKPRIWSDSARAAASNISVHQR